MKKYLFAVLSCMIFSFPILAQDAVLNVNGNRTNIFVTNKTSNIEQNMNFNQFEKISKGIYSNEQYNTVFKQPGNTGYQNGKYFSLAAGYGNSYGGLGIRAQVRFGGIFGFGIHAGAGYFPAFSLGESGDTKYKGAFLASLGVKLFFYKALYLNAQFGAFGYAEKMEMKSYSYYYYGYYYSGYEYNEKKGLLYGPSALIGGDFIFGENFGFNGAIGVSFNINKDFKTLKNLMFFLL